MSSDETPNLIQINGYCAKGYQPLKELFVSNFHTGKENNAQLCIYVNDECVVDLYGTAIGDASYTQDSIQPIFSCGKNIAAIVVARLVDQDLLQYDAQVTDYWPEFGQNGKGGDNITIADVLRHECGLTNFGHTFVSDDFLTENIKQNRIGEMIERSETSYPRYNFNPDGSESKRSYHFQTRGLILNEIVRRVDVKGRTIGEILREDINIDGLFCGLTDKDITRVSPLESKSMSWVILNSVIPYFMGSKVDFNIFELYQRKRMLADSLRKTGPQTPLFGSFSREPHLRHAPYEDAVIRKGEIPSSNCYGNARGLAKLAATMLYNEEHSLIDDKNDRLLSQKTWQKLHDHSVWSEDAAFGIRTCFTQGGINKFHLPENPSSMEKLILEPRKGYYGWFGFGGSVMQWHPDLKIGFGYVPTLLHWYDVQGKRGAELQKLTVECAEKNQQS